MSELAESKKPRHFKLMVKTSDYILYRLLFNYFITPNDFIDNEQLEVIEYSAYEQLQKQNKELIEALEKKLEIAVKALMDQIKDADYYDREDIEKSLEEIEGEK